MELFWQALTIMTLGMVLVFLFIFVVIQCMHFTAYLIHRYAVQHPVPADNDAVITARACLAAAIAVALDHTSTK